MSNFTGHGPIVNPIVNAKEASILLVLLKSNSAPKPINSEEKPSPLLK